MYKIDELLNANTYPGRGLILGSSEDGDNSLLVYFIMGRSINSRNRVFEKTSDGIRTKAHDPALMTDPSLVIYHPVRILDGRIIVTNGDQTDTIREYLLKGGSFHEALLTREYEPDPPNYTPRISGMFEQNGSYRISILKTADGTPACCLRCFYEYSAPIPGMGHFISTYKTDGDPLPPFEGDPIPIEITVAGGLESFAGTIWDALNEENKVSLYARKTNLTTGEAIDIMFNKNT